MLTSKLYRKHFTTLQSTIIFLLWKNFIRLTTCPAERIIISRIIGVQFCYLRAHAIVRFSYLYKIFAIRKLQIW